MLRNHPNARTNTGPRPFLGRTQMLKRARRADMMPRLLQGADINASLGMNVFAQRNFVRSRIPPACRCASGPTDFLSDPACRKVTSDNVGYRKGPKRMHFLSGRDISPSRSKRIDPSSTLPPAFGAEPCNSALQRRLRIILISKRRRSGCTKCPRTRRVKDHVC